MSKNILKFHQIVYQDEDKLMIDNNEVVAKKLERIEEEMMKAAVHSQPVHDSEDFVGGIQAELVELVEGEDADAQMLTSDAAVDMAVFERQSKEMIESARQDAESIRAEAVAEVEALKISAIEEAKNQGYTDGYKEGMAQVEEERINLEERRLALEREYQELVAGLEPKFVEVLTDIYGHVFQTDLKKEKTIISHLISTTMHKIEGNSSYLVHVAKEDYSYVVANKEEILSGVVPINASVDIVEDITLSSGDCIIETEGGVFDCGLGTQLEELAQKLKLLSYTRG